MERLDELYRGIGAAVAVCQSAYGDGDLVRALEGARIVLSLGSKLHARFAMLSELSAEGYWTAEVDRAVRRAEKETPGQLSIEDAIADGSSTTGARALAKRQAERKASRRK